VVDYPKGPDSFPFAGVFLSPFCCKKMGGFPPKTMEVFFGSVTLGAKIITLFCRFLTSLTHTSELPEVSRV